MRCSSFFSVRNSRNVIEYWRMQKIVTTFLLLGAMISQAAMVEYKDMPDEVAEALVYSADFNTEFPDVNDLHLNLRGNKEGVACVGVDKGYENFWQEGIEHNGAARSNSFTVSLDIRELAGQQEAALLSMYSFGMNRTRGLLLCIGRRNTLELVCNGFTNTTTSGRRARITIGNIDELIAERKTISIVYNGSANTITVYVDAEALDKKIKLRYDGKPASKQYTVLQFGGCYGGGCSLKRGQIDNLSIWNIALSEDQVASIVQGRVSPMVWQVLAAGGGLLVFALQALLFYMAGRRSVLRKTQPLGE